MFKYVRGFAIPDGWEEITYMNLKFGKRELKVDLFDEEGNVADKFLNIAMYRGE